MSHKSEDAHRLKITSHKITDITHASKRVRPDDSVYLYVFPHGRTDIDAAQSESIYLQLSEQFSQLSQNSVVCILTSAPDAARIQPYLQKSLKFQLWVSVKATAKIKSSSHLPNNHLALLILTRYQGTLQHTKTRIAYTYCPACQKTTKDYGGKKHTYHHYGTLMSDVWRDFEYSPNGQIEPITTRLADLFGLKPYTHLEVFDFKSCPVLQTCEKNTPIMKLSSENGQQTNRGIKSRLINGDCLISLKKIPNNSIHFCFADPPYNIMKKYDDYNDGREISTYFDWCDKWLAELARILRPGCTCAVLNIPLWAIRHYQFMAKVLNFQTWIVWEALSLPVRMIMPAHYAIVCFSKGLARPLPGLSGATLLSPEHDYLTAPQDTLCLRSSCISRRIEKNQASHVSISDLWWDVHRLKHNSYRVDHPCQLPPMLMRRLFALFTNKEETILDCFNGAGTSTLIAQEMNRKYIGIELSTQYHELALQRHDELNSGLNPFRKRDGVPTAKNSRVVRLQKQKYDVPKKILQLDVKRIANKIGRLPSPDDVKRLSEYPFRYFENYFVSWGEVCAAARTTGMSELKKTTRIKENQMGLLK